MSDRSRRAATYRKATAKAAQWVRENRPGTWNEMWAEAAHEVATERRLGGADHRLGAATLSALRGEP